MARHIKNFQIVKKAMEEYFAKQLQRETEELELYKSCFGNPKCWDEECQRYRVKRKGEKLKNGAVITEDDIKRREELVNKWIPKDIRYWAQRLDAADTAGKMIEINMDIRWGRQRIGCGCPHAEVWLFFEDAQYGSSSGYSTGTAGGCGYDLRSAAMQDALNFDIKKSDSADRREAKAKAKASLDRFVIEHGEALWKEYAIDRKPIPHLSISGKGSNVFTSLFRKVGCKPYMDFAVKDYLLDYRETDNGSDVYHVIRKDRI